VQRVTTFIVGWFAGSKYKDHYKWYIQPPKLLRRFYHKHAI